MKLLCLIAVLTGLVVSTGAVAGECFTGKIYPTPQKVLSSYRKFNVDPAKVVVNYSGDSFGPQIYKQAIDGVSSSIDDAPLLSITAGLISSPDIRNLVPELELPPQGYALRCTEFTPERVSIVIAGADNRGVIYGFATLKQLFSIEDGKAVQLIADINDFPVWTNRFICDFFANFNSEYIQFYAENKVAGIAGLTNAEWRNPQWWEKVQPQLDIMKQFHDRDIMTFMAQLHIYSTPPGKPKMNLSNEQEIDNFIECCRKMAEHGATYFMIAADDSTPRGVDGYKLYSTEEQQKFASAGEAHGYLMKRIYDALKPEFPDIHLAMVAAPYSLDHGIGTPSIDKYVTDWAKTAPDEVAWIWTGWTPGPGKPYVAKEQKMRITRLLGNHKAFIFDNSNGIYTPLVKWETSYYPGMEKDDNGIAFLLGLGCGSRPWETVYFINACDYLWNPDAYNADASYSRALEIVFGKEAVQPVNQLRKALLDADMERRLNRRNNIAGKINDLEEAFSQFKAAKDASGKPLPDKQLETAVNGLKAFAQYQPKEIIVYPALNNITVDGNLNEDEWSGATEFMLADRSGNCNGKYVKVRITYRENDAAYLAFSIPSEQKNDIPDMPHDSPVFLNPEALEIMLQTTEDFQPGTDADYSGSYAHLAFDRAGNTFDEDADNGSYAWDGDWQLAVKDTADGWCAEMRVPAQKIQFSTPQPPAPGVVWMGNFFYINNNTGSVQSWDTNGYTFHMPEYFGVLKFAERE